jgi:hypothetical protein
VGAGWVRDRDGDRVSTDDGKRHVSEIAARLKELTEQRDQLRSALKELHAMVWGECPSLLNEDSGGSSRLDMECEVALHRADLNP